jgi:23S rRNA (pseudouridine1915-N3)-methyltransferase
LTVVQQGRLRDPAIKVLRDEYVKRFRRFGTLTIVEWSRRGADPWPSGTGFRVALDESGSQPGSVEFAALLAGWTERHGPVAFLVGDADGIWTEARSTVDQWLSLSSLTMPHQLAHLLLVEQLYRAATIGAGLPYHRG